MGGKGGDWTAGKPRYPLAALVAAVGCSEAELARMVGLSGSSLVAARERGMVEQAAERYAVRAGLHPFVVWPEMAEHAIADAERECIECGARFVPRHRLHQCCSPACGRRRRARRYAARRRATPEGREENIAKVRAWRESLGPAAQRAQKAKQRRRQRAWMEANREHVRAQRAAYRKRRYREDPAYRERVLAKQRERDRAKAEARRRAREAMGEAA